MEPRDLIEFAERPWDEVATADAEHWRARKRALGPIAGVRIAAELWAFARVQRPDWPTAVQREADLETHRRVSEGLRSVAIQRPR